MKETSHCSDGRAHNSSEAHKDVWLEFLSTGEKMLLFQKNIKAEEISLWLIILPYSFIVVVIVCGL